MVALAPYPAPPLPPGPLLSLSTPECGGETAFPLLELEQDGKDEGEGEPAADGVAGVAGSTKPAAGGMVH